MAEGSGIDRKADDRMEFTTSADVTVAPTFQDMHLKGIFTTIRILRIWSSRLTIL